MPAVFTSIPKLLDRLDDGEEHDVFVYDGRDREVVLENDCRRFPLRLRAVVEDAPEVLDAFCERCRDTYGASFSASLPGAETANIPDVAVKIGVYHTLDTIEVHFYKSADRRDRRRIIDWLLGEAEGN